MVTERLDLAVKNFQHMNQMVERYTRLCRAYVQLSERFNQLDVEHMTLKGQVVPLLKTLKAQQARLQEMQAEKETWQHALDRQLAQHRQELQTLTRTYEERLETLSHHVEELKPLEHLLSPAAYQDLAVAEQQMELVEVTLQEMDEDSSPDLTEEEKALLAAYRSDPEAFLGSPALLQAW
jgi:chromosome segregation ATPase